MVLAWSPTSASDAPNPTRERPAAIYGVTVVAILLASVGAWLFDGDLSA